MMRRCLCFLLPWLLVGCAAQPTLQYYALSLPSQPPVSQSLRQGPLLQVQSLALPDYLAQAGIAFQQDDIQLTLANQARWAEPLDRQLVALLLAQLEQDLPQLQLQGPLETGQQWRLNLFVDAFQGRFDGQAVIAGRWVLQGPQGQRHSGRFHQLEPLSDDGYPALVRALQKGWLQQAHLLAGQLQPLIR